MALDEALSRLEEVDPARRQLVKLRFFAGLTMQEAAQALGISLRTAERHWTYARTWLHRAWRRGGRPPETFPQFSGGVCRAASHCL